MSNFFKHSPLIIQSDKLKEAILESINQIKQDNKIYLNDNFVWDKDIDILLLNGIQVKLTNYEMLLLKALFKTPNKTISYEDLHYYIYEDMEFSQASLSNIVKRIKKKIPSELIQSSYKEGYKVVTII